MPGASTWPVTSMARPRKRRSGRRLAGDLESQRRAVGPSGGLAPVSGSVGPNANGPSRTSRAATAGAGVAILVTSGGQGAVERPGVAQVPHAILIAQVDQGGRVDATEEIDRVERERGGRL